MHLPHLASYQRSPIVFLTMCVSDRRPLLADADVHDILLDIWAQSGARNGWYVGHYVLMPDHVHFFARAAHEAIPLSDWVRLWKSISATRINRMLALKEALWQADFFDRYLRTNDDYGQKWSYVEQNPVRKGLVMSPTLWPFRGTIFDLGKIHERG